MTDARPLALHRETVIEDWIDYNGHMNLAYYALVFDHATDALLDHVGLDAAHRDAAGGSVFVVESHVTYGAEVMRGEEMKIETRVLDVGGKRLRLFHEMYVTRAGAGRTRAAANELLILHVNLASRRTAPFPAAILEALQILKAGHDALLPPPEAGRGIAFERPKHP
ncbi:MAG: thioesterase family protein [Rhodospirillaceae bacterium]